MNVSGPETRRLPRSWRHPIRTEEERNLSAKGTSKEEQSGEARGMFNEYWVLPVGHTEQFIFAMCLSDQVIGETGVFVPTHLYKLILAEKRDNNSDKEGRHFMAAFVVPNKHISKENTLKDFWYTSEWEVNGGFAWNSWGDLSSGYLYLNWNDASGIGSIQVSTEVQLETSVRSRAAMWASGFV